MLVSKNIIYFSDSNGANLALIPDPYAYLSGDTSGVQNT